MKSITTIFAFLLTSLICNGQSQDLPNGSEPGKCYAKCLAPIQLGPGAIDFPVYIGNDQSIIQYYVKDTSLVISKPQKNWVKQKDENCISTVPADCFTWVLNESGGEYLEVKNFLIDKTVTSDYEMKSVEADNVKLSEGFTEWFEIVCADKVTSYMVNKIRGKLSQAGFNINDTDYNGSLGKDTKQALINYQKEHDLPVGNLDRKTMEHLGIPF